MAIRLFRSHQGCVVPVGGGAAVGICARGGSPAGGSSEIRRGSVCNGSMGILVSGSSGMVACEGRLGPNEKREV